MECGAVGAAGQVVHTRSYVVLALGQVGQLLVNLDAQLLRQQRRRQQRRRSLPSLFLPITGLHELWVSELWVCVARRLCAIHVCRSTISQGLLLQLPGPPCHDPARDSHGDCSTTYIDIAALVRHLLTVCPVPRPTAAQSPAAMLQPNSPYNLLVTDLSHLSIPERRRLVANFGRVNGPTSARRQRERGRRHQRRRATAGACAGLELVRSRPRREDDARWDVDAARLVS
jgi:hypothetical protein